MSCGKHATFEMATGAITFSVEAPSAGASAFTPYRTIQPITIRRAGRASTVVTISL